jgi:aryl carrier-like protein
MNALADPSTVLETPASLSESDENSMLQDHHATNGLNGTLVFNWTENALIIRNEIAKLTGADLSDINESTSIFELGLDSIDAIKLSSKLKGCGVDLPVSGIMRGLTIKNMVANILSSQTRNTRSQVDKNFALRKRDLRRHVEQRGVELSEVADVLPLTPLQEAMVAEMITSEYTRYYNFDVSELAADTSIHRLLYAWCTVIESSPILRTSFIEVDDPQIEGSFAQVIIRQKPSGLWIQLKKSGVEGKPHFTAIFEDLRRAAIQSKALDPPVKITLLETSGHNYQILSIAHALYDGWSLGLLHDAVNAAYHGQYTPRPSYEATLADILSGSGPDAANFWRDYLTGLQPSFFPRRHVGSIEEPEKVYRKEHASDIGLSKVTAFAKNSKVSLQTLGQTVFALTLASYTHSLDVTFGSVLSGRDDDERSQLLFPTMNTVAIRTILHGSRMDMLQYVQQSFNSIKQWQHFPLRKALALVGAQGKLFDSLFIYQKGVEEGSSTEKKLYESVESQSDVEYPVCLEMEVVNKELVWRCAVKAEVLSLEGAQMLLSRVDEVLRNIIQHPDKQTIESTPQGTSVCGLPAFNENMHAPNLEDKQEDVVSSINAPLSQTATRIRKALAFVSQIPEEDIARGMSIFHIGLDSISAIKVSSILRKHGIALSVGEMLKAGTVENMAKLVDMRTTPPIQDMESSALIKEALCGLDQLEVLSQAGIGFLQVDRILPLTAGQLYMVSMWLNTKGTNFYPEFVYDLEGSVGFEILLRSWKALIAANPVLRTCIVATAHNDFPYVQVVLREADASLTDITGQDEAAETRTMQSIAMRQPWIHVFLSQTSTGWSLRLKMHHALYDGVSLPLLMQQFGGLCNGAPTFVPDDKLDKYIAVAHTASALSQRTSFWTKYLEGTPQPYKSKAEIASKSRTEVFKPGLLQTYTLEGTARQHGISTQALFLAVYARLYAANVDSTDGEDVVIGIYLANRSFNIDDISTAAVPTVNLLPLRVQSPLGTAILDVASQIQMDLQKISDPVNATSSLFEINEWTGVKIDTFVNFLTLPDTDEESSQKGAIKIKHRESWQEAISRVTELDQADCEVASEMVNERVNATYLVSSRHNPSTSDGEKTS